MHRRSTVTLDLMLRFVGAVTLAYGLTVLLYLSIQVAAALGGWTEDETP
jgi:hypothetical protein